MTTQYPIQRIIGATPQCVKLDILVITPLGNRVITRDAAGQQGGAFHVGGKIKKSIVLFAQDSSLRMAFGGSWYLVSEICPKTEMRLQDLPDLTLVYFWCIILIERSINTLHLREA